MNPSKAIHRPPSAERLSRGRRRRGAAAVFGVMMLGVITALLAMTLDLGHINVSRSEMRRTADAAAMAACWRLFDEVSTGADPAGLHDELTETASEIALQNVIGGHGPRLAADGTDLQMGYVDWTNPVAFDTSDPSRFNAVRATIQRRDGVNGEIPLYFGNILGVHSQPLVSSATAAMLTEIRGFQALQTAGQCVQLLPIAMDLPTWQAMVAGETEDVYQYTRAGGVNSGSDGMHEGNLYPKGNGAPGNRGMVDIGGANNSTSDIARQIVYGISQQDFADLGQPLVFNDAGKLYLNGDTGISAGVKDELASIIGQTRTIPIFEEVSGNGNNATYTIVRFAGVRILDVRLTGPKNGKCLIVQPAPMVVRGAVPAPAAQDWSDYLYGPVTLVQ